jgi:hypothetical protein
MRGSLNMLSPAAAIQLLRSWTHVHLGIFNHNEQNSSEGSEADSRRFNRQQRLGANKIMENITH